MAELTFQVLEGMERGRVLSNLQPPVTIGREEDNGIQLNDERVSRFHAKVQEDSGRIILTDLESTNGTRVNGHPIQMHVLRIGDQVSIGRCLLLFGSADEIEERIKERQQQIAEGPQGTVAQEADEYDLDSDSSRDSDEELPRMFPDGPPELPMELKPVQVAQLSDLLAHLHDRLRSLLVAGKSEGSSKDDSGETPSNSTPFTVDWVAWQRALQLEMDMASYIRSLTNPQDEE